MTDAEQERFNALFAMFESDGYRYLLANIEKDIELFDNVLAIKDENDLYFRKGVLSTLRTMRALAENTKTQYDMQQEGENYDSRI